MDNQYPLYLIPTIPLAGAALNLLLGKRFGKQWAGLVGVGAVAIAMLISWHAAFVLWKSPDWFALRGALLDGDWFFASELNPAHAISIKAGLMLDRLSSMMTLVITTVGLLIHIYSTAYMAEDEGYSRYFGYLNLFTGAMLILVLGDSLPVTFVGWEGVGLCSYLLIGFWFTKEQNAYAGRKAFVVNRIGDFGFLLGMFLLFSAAGTLQYDELAKSDSLVMLRMPFLGGVFRGASYATFAGLLLFIGCAGKSAQLPLYVWLPDAMAGPTPVSALIHAATMVTAGVYLVARMHFVFELDVFVLATVAVVGALTALFAATMGLVARPIKKILAYSTVSQLGFMFIGVGTGSYGAGTFHLMTHAFFKAGLFLGAGSIMHALAGEEDVMKMGGLKKKLRWTHATFLIYCLAIAGIPPFAGFFSKDSILASAFAFDYSVRGWPHWLGPTIGAIGLLAALCTSFYMFRAYFLVFHGKFRGPGGTEGEEWHHVHESPPEMTVPLVLLAIGSVVLGFLGIPPLAHALEGMNFFQQWLPPRLAKFNEPHHSSALILTIGATAIGVVGLLIAWALYGKGPAPVLDRITRSVRPLYKLVFNKYWVDELYDRIIVRPLRWLAWFSWKVIDAFIIDLVIVRGSAVVVDSVGRALRYIQNGDAQRYIVGVVVGTAALLVGASWWSARSASAFSVEFSGQDVVVRAKAQPIVGTGTIVRPLEYTFDFGDGTPPVKQSAAVAHHHYDQGGKRKITVTVRDPRWNSDSRRSQTVEVK